MSIRERSFHEFILRMAFNFKPLQDAIIEQDSRFILGYVKWNEYLKREISERKLIKPDKLDMIYLYQRLEESIAKGNMKGVKLAW